MGDSPTFRHPIETPEKSKEKRIRANAKFTEEKKRKRRQ
jgi:hypothetical protein